MQKNTRIKGKSAEPISLGLFKPKEDVNINNVIKTAEALEKNQVIEICKTRFKRHREITVTQKCQSGFYLLVIRNEKNLDLDYLIRIYSNIPNHNYL